MIDVGEFIGYLDDIGINFFCGVPESQLSPFCDYLEENCRNIIAANEGNAVAMAKTPNLDRLMKEYPFVEGQASGLAVGLPDGQMGNSEVGHLNMGAGRVV